MMPNLRVYSLILPTSSGDVLLVLVKVALGCKNYSGVRKKRGGGE